MASETQQKKMRPDIQRDGDDGVTPGSERSQFRPEREKLSSHFHAVRRRVAKGDAAATRLRLGAVQHLRPRSPFACVHFPQSRGSRGRKNSLGNKGRSLCEHPWVALCLSKASAVVKKTDSCSFVNTIVRNDPCYLFARCHGYR